jgi:hypothetical protein
MNTYIFLPEFIKLLSNILDSKNIENVYNLNHNVKYSIEYIRDIIITISEKSYSRYRLHNKLAAYLKESAYSKYSKTDIKNLIKQQLAIIIDDPFFEIYIIIGYDIPIDFKELNVIC